MKVHHLHFSKIDSTNKWAKLHLNEFDADAVTVISANEQTAAKGRFHHVWLSPPDKNVYVTFCFCFQKERKDTANLSQVMGISVARVLEGMGLKPNLKWPNDIQVNTKKIGGILCELINDEECCWCLLGVGLNVNMSPKELEAIGQKATSIYVELGKEFLVNDVLKRLEEVFLENLEIFQAEGFSSFLQEYMEWLSPYIGRSISFHSGKSVVNGVLHSIREDGALNLLLPNGEVQTFLAGEIAEDWL